MKNIAVFLWKSNRLSILGIEHKLGSSLAWHSACVNSYKSIQKNSKIYNFEQIPIILIIHK